MKLTSIRGHNTIKIHVILSQRAGLIEATKLNNAAHDDLILRDAEYLLLIQSFQGVDDAEGHADWQCRRYSDQDDVDELDDDI